MSLLMEPPAKFSDDWYLSHPTYGRALAAIEAGTPRGRAAREFHVSISILGGVADRLGLPRGKQGGGKRDIGNRLDLMIGFRENGLTYAAIGKMYGITRERVRQLLVRANRPEVMGFLPHTRRERAFTPRLMAICKACGAERAYLASQRKPVFCSKRCCSLGELESVVRRRIAEIFEARLKGESWASLGKRFGWPDSTQPASDIQEWLRGRCKTLAIDRSSVMGLYFHDGQLTRRPGCGKRRSETPDWITAASATANPVAEKAVE